MSCATTDPWLESNQGGVEAVCPVAGHASAVQAQSGGYMDKNLRSKPAQVPTYAAD